MQLVSIQPCFVYDILASGQSFQPRPQLDPEHWLNESDGPLEAYEWLGRQMQARNLARPTPDSYPVWAWYQWYGPTAKRPDLRTSSMKRWGRSERMVELLLELPDEDVLLSDYDAWHFALNYWYLGRPRDTRAFTRRCKAVGLSYYRNKPLPDAALHAELQGSWQQMLDMDAARRVLQCRAGEQVIQATFWTLRPDHVVRVREFGQGRPLQRLACPGTGLSATE